MGEYARMIRTLSAALALWVGVTVGVLAGWPPASAQIQTAGASAAALVTQAAGQPTTTPSAVGARYYDTTNLDWYVATGTSSSADWEFSHGTTFTSGVVSGGAVTTVSTGTIPALIDGAEYAFGCKIVAAGTSAVRFFVGGDETVGNYRRGYVSSSGGSSDDSSVVAASAAAAGDVNGINGRIRVVQGEVRIDSIVNRTESSSARGSVQMIRHVSLISVTSIQVTSDTANDIDNGSEIWLRRIK